jgi:flagellar biosynthetic protein FliQ
MSESVYLEICAQTIWVAIQLVGPLLIAGTVVGLMVSLFQAVTQINEMTLTFIPKLAVTILILVMMGPWMLHTFQDFTTKLFLDIPVYVR